MEPIVADLKAQIAQVASTASTLSTDVGRWMNEVDNTLNAMKADIAALKAGGGTTTPPVQEWEPAFPGDTRPGMIRWGCSYNSNGVPSPHETAAGVAVGVRRTFWRLDQASSIISTCKADHTAGRLPWVSIKLSATWQNTANGALDTPIINLIKSLGLLGLPVWFSVHHEPEGGNGTAYPDEGQGSEIHWRNMQKRIRQLLDSANVTNIAFAPILMAWTFDTRSGRNPADWWVDGIWDFAGIDHYVEAANTTVLSTMWKNALAYYKAKGLKIGVAEWGNKDHTLTGAAEMQEWFDHLRTNNVVGAAYFDTSLNGGVPLSGDALIKFRELMNSPYSLLVSEV
jgi:hypothetical protein